ncbi:hypothetical protein F5X96DRAFT_690983 [Biscogniauxia mediterranea]|nr:hypothetical protein F5X96DRAFT_690983 [Biscogniauxia mediterranea]
MRSPARDSTSRDRPHHRKRASSFTGFISKIFPTNRPEQGGTWRPEDAPGEHDSAYKDLGINPNELTDWNFAKEPPPPKLAAAAAISDTPTSHRKRRGWTPRKKASPTPPKDIGEPGRPKHRPRSYSGLGTPSLLPPEPFVSSPLRKSDTLTRAEISNLLKLKEASRRSRRDLKESGDWLGVQGADPYSGEFSVLTPTTTLSSVTTSSSTKDMLAGLNQKKREARLAYKELKQLEEQEKGKAKQEKQISKLGKIERVKEDLKQQQDFVRWSQHKRQWSSAAEPNLSPIAQSLSNLTSSNHSDITGQPGSSHMSRLPTSAAMAPLSEAGLPKSENPQPQPQDSFADRSTDTIIHKSSGRQSDPNIALSPPDIVIHPPSISSGKGVSPNRPKVVKPFLWRRHRRTIEPEGLARSLDADLASNIPKHPPTGTLADVEIPDYHIHLTSPETSGESSSQSTLFSNSLSSSSTQTAPEVTEESPTAPTTKTNLPEQGQAKKDVDKATVTSSQSKLKGSMKPLYIPQKLVRSRLPIAQAKDIQKKQKEVLGEDHLRNHPHQDHLPGGTQESRKELLLMSTERKKVKHDEAGEIPQQVRCRIETLQRESVSTHITITTGSAPVPQIQRSGKPSQPRAQTDQDVKVITSTIGDQATPESSSDRTPCTKLDPVRGENGTSSRPVTSQNGLPRPEPDQEIAETGTTSTRHVTADGNMMSTISAASLPNVFQTRRDPIEQKARQNAGSGTNPMPTFKIRFQRVQSHLRPPPQQQQTHNEGDHIETMIQEAARIAMQRSQAMTTTVHRTPSGRAVTREQQKAPETAAHQLRFRKFYINDNSNINSSNINSSSEAAGTAGTGVLSKFKLAAPSMIAGLGRRKAEPAAAAAAAVVEGGEEEEPTNTNQGQTPEPELEPEPEQQKGKEDGDHHDDDAADMDAVATLAHVAGTLLGLALGLARAWWQAAVWPAFDGRGEVRRRRRAGRSEWRDLAVFASAGVFCLACAWAGAGVAGWGLRICGVMG